MPALFFENVEFSEMVKDELCLINIAFQTENIDAKRADDKLRFIKKHLKI